MKHILIGLLSWWVCGLALATPLENFRDKLNATFTMELPPFFITWDSESDTSQKLKDRDWEAYYKLMETKAKEHERFLQKITGVKEIKCDEYGYRRDRLNIESVSYTAREWLLQVCDHSNGLSSKFVSWSKLTKVVVDDQGMLEFYNLRREAEQLAGDKKSGNASAFYTEIDEAIKALERIYEGKVISVDDQKKVVRFIDKWAK